MTLKSEAKFEEKLICCFKNFDLRTRNSQNFHFDWFLCAKYITFHTKKVQTSYVPWQRRMIQHLKRNRYKTIHEKFDEFLPEHLKVSKICALMGSFWTKYIMFELKKYRGVMFHDNEKWSKIWRKTDFWFGKWRKEFGKVLPEHSEVSKLRLLWDSFIQSRKCISLKFTGELCIMTMKNDSKFEEELTCRFKIDTTIWRILTRALEYL